MGVDAAAAIVAGLSVSSLRADPAAIAAAEHELVEAALGISAECAVAASADELRQQAAVWRSLIDPDGVEPDEERAMRHRCLRDPIRGANQGRAITLRDGGCVIPGCRVPASWCEIGRYWDDVSGAAAG